MTAVPAPLVTAQRRVTGAVSAYIIKKFSSTEKPSPTVRESHISVSLLSVTNRANSRIGTPFRNSSTMGEILVSMKTWSAL